MKNILTILLTGFITFSLFAQEDLEKELKQLQEQIKEIEGKCTPKKGISRKDVEKIFGRGKPAANYKKGGDRQLDLYELCEDGKLLVYYQNDIVERAHFINPFSSKGIPIGKDIPIKQKIDEAKKRLKQMKAILKTYLKKTKNL